MTSLRDEMAFWQTKALDAHHNLLDTIQNSAGKWQAAIAAFLGVYATTSFVLGPDKLATLPVHGGVEIGTVIIYGIAGIIGVIALLLANLASQGIPQIMSGTPVTAQLMYELVTRRAMTARSRLRWSMRLAGVAGILILAISGFLLGAGIRAQDHPDYILISSTESICGPLTHFPDGEVGIQLPNGFLISAAGASLTPVNSCP